MSKHSANPLTSLAVFPIKTKMEVQGDTEKIQLIIRQDLVTNIPRILVSFFIAVVPFVVFSSFGRDSLGADLLLDVVSVQTRTTILIIWYLFLAMYMFQSILLWFFNVLVVTNERIIDLDVSWPFHRVVTEARLEQVQDVSLKQGGLFASVFNYGSIYVQTAGIEQNIEITRCPQPGFVHDRITDFVEEVK